MLVQLLIEHPAAIVKVVQSTPAWVWGLLAALLAVGLGQMRARTVSLLRVSLVPVVMAGFSLWGMASAFGSTPQGALVIALWLNVAAIVTAIVARGESHATYDASNRTYAVPGSVVPLLMIAGIFLVKWSLGVELAMQPELARDAGFGLSVGAVYGVFNGLFTGRALRLWRLAFHFAPLERERGRLVLQRDPW